MVTLSGVSIKNSFISGSTLEIRNFNDSSYGNMIVENLTVLGTQTINNTSSNQVSGQTLYFLSGTTGTPTLNAWIEIIRGNQTDATLIWDESNDLWKAGLKGSEQSIAYDANVVHLFGDEEISGLKTFNDQILIGTGITGTYLDYKW